MSKKFKNRGGLWPVEEKSSKKAPDLTGSLDIKGKRHLVSCWLQDDDALSLSIQPDTGKKGVYSKKRYNITLKPSKKKLRKANPDFPTHMRNKAKVGGKKIRVVAWHDPKPEGNKPVYGLAVGKPYKK